MKKNRKYSKNGGFHIAKMVPLEVIGYGTVVALWPIVGFVPAAIAAVVAVFIGYKTLIALRNVMRNVPTVLGYGDVAVASSKKVALAQKAKVQPKPITQPAKILV